MAAMRTPYRRLVNRGFNANQDTAALVFEPDDSDYLSFTPAGSTGRDQWSYFRGFKITELGINGTMLSAASDTTNYFILRRNTDNTIFFQLNRGGVLLEGTTNAIFTDVTAKYHAAFLFDPSEAAAADRFKIYVVGHGYLSITFTTNIAPNSTNGMVNTAVEHNIGRFAVYGTQFNSEVLSYAAMYAGTIVDPETVFDLDALGVLQAVNLPDSGFGADGWLLQFDDISTDAALGTDTSGQSNTWTVTNLTTDDASSEAWSKNYCAWNPLDKTGSATVTNGALDFNEASAGDGIRGTIPVTSGKWYWETPMTLGADGQTIAGIALADSPLPSSTSIATVPSGNFVYRDDGYAIEGGAGTLYTDVTSGQVVRHALDLDNDLYFIGINGTWVNSGDPEAGTGAVFNLSSYTGRPFVPYAGFQATTGTNIFSLNAGQKDFSYTAPTGFKAINTANLPKPASATSVTPLTGSFTGTASSDRNYVYLGYTPDQDGTCTINGNAITWGTHAIATANGFYTITASASYNASGSNTYSIAVKYPFGGKGIAPAPAQIN